MAGQAAGGYDPMITIAQAVADLTAAPRPILFLDTCTLLDIVRAPLRDRTLAVRAGVELRTLAAAGEVRLFVQDIVRGEWTDNLPAARRDGETGVRAFTATWQIAADLGQPAPPLPVLPPGTLIDELGPEKGTAPVDHGRWDRRAPRAGDCGGLGYRRNPRTVSADP